MPLTISKSVVYHPRTLHGDALGTMIRVSSRMYTYPPGSRERIWKSHTVEATLRDASPPPPESSAGAFMYMSTKDKYVFELSQTADYSLLTEDLLRRSTLKNDRQIAEYENSVENARFLENMRMHASIPPILYLSAGASDHIIATGDILTLCILGDRTIYELLGYIEDIEIIT